MWQLCTNYFVTRNTQNAVCGTEFCNSELCKLDFRIKQAKRRKAKTLKMHPIDYCKMIDSLQNEEDCKTGIKNEQDKCRYRRQRKSQKFMKSKRGQKKQSCKFKKIFNQVTKRRRDKRRASSLGSISIQFSNKTIRRRRRKMDDNEKPVNCSEWKGTRKKYTYKKEGGREKRVITVACVVGISALVRILFFNFEKKNTFD